MNNQLTPLTNFANNLTPGQNIETYLRTVQSLPLLSAEDEKKLAEKLNTDHDLNAARELILSSLRYVVPVARSYNGYGLPLADLIQEGNIGLMKAVKRFKASENVRLMTFAIHWIRAEMNEYVIKNWRIVKTATTKAQRKLFFKLRSSKKTLEWFGDKDADKVAKELGVTRKDVLEMETRLYGKDMPVDMSNDDEENEYKSYPVLVSNEPDPETALVASTSADYQNAQLSKALLQLDDRSKEIIQKRWLNDSKTGLKELSTQYGISMERVRQVEQQAIKKLRLAIPDST
jgi:RNA polymerase sigma-32 factor